ncbi:Hypothetical protein2 [Nesidiocoris tenuis]|uniref:Endonuclease n=2 Tax=Nesidiocoris tenuis TaxID=355587 RepID=A0ABN7B3V2_9HEMI|nr:Hypothetical protein2 [Nesidiocoris tenuis]
MTYVNHIPVFSGANFSNWQFRLSAILEKEKVLSVLSAHPPIKDEEKEIFSAKDVQARSIIIQGIQDKHLDIIKDCQSAKAMMEALKKVFVRNSSMSKLNLWRKLIALKFDVDGRLEDHFLAFDSIIRDLCDQGTKFDEPDKVCHLLLSLPQQYESVITALETVSDVKLDFVKSRLLDEELKIASKQPYNGDKEEVVFKASNSGCYLCGNKSHYKAQCPRNNSRGSRGRRGQTTRRRYFRRSSEQAHQSEEISLVALNCPQPEMRFESNNIFLVDSGASVHLFKSELEPWMTSVVTMDKEVAIQIANGQKMAASRRGKLRALCQGRYITIEGLIVPGLRHNLLSVSKMTQKGLTVTIDEKLMWIRGRNFELSCVFMNGLYVLEVSDFSSPCACSVSSPSQNNLWHQRMGHPGKDALRQLNLPYSDDLCQPCIEGKTTRQPFRSQVKTSRDVGDRVCIDICGPINPPTFDGCRYILVMLDEASHFVVVRLLKTKDEAEGKIRNYVSETERQLGIHIKKLRLDNAGEFKSNSFQKYARERGMVLEYSMAHSSQMNGAVERMNRQLLNMIRVKISDSNIPKKLWGKPSSRRCMS